MTQRLITHLRHVDLAVPDFDTQLAFYRDLLGFELRWGMGKMVGVMLAGCVPFLSFWVERRVAGQVESELAAARQ